MRKLSKPCDSCGRNLRSKPLPACQNLDHMSIFQRYNKYAKKGGYGGYYLYRRNPALFQYKVQVRNAKKYGWAPPDKDEYIRAYLYIHNQNRVVCEICQKRIATSVDHDHKSGRVRGYLCSPCNRFLGWFDREPSSDWKTLAVGILDYLANNEATQ
jgi:hypothetical protein